MPGNRVEKVNSLLEHEIGEIIQREVHFGVGILATLTHVKVTANLIEARVYISVFPEDKASQVLAILKKEVGGIQKEINKKLNMRPIPKLIFVLDKKEAEAGRIEELLGQLKKEEK
jgi:ribosome-binding factor A